MLIKKRTGIDIPSSEITPKSVYLSRRAFMGGAAAVAGAAALAACAPKTDLSGAGSAARVQATAEAQAAAGITPDPTAAPVVIPGQTDEQGNPLTEYESVTGYNNFYEFSTNKEAVAGRAEGFQSSPWQVAVGGLVRNRPGTYDIEDLRTRFTAEERIYRLRCVEGWSMVIPWLGFPLAALLNEVEPTSRRAVRPLRDAL
jgi:sulfoxide reductase catalytic subunit YedY